MIKLTAEYYLAEALNASLQVKTSVQPIQTSEGERIRGEVQAFTKRVHDYQKKFRTRSFYKYATGAARAYPELDQVSHLAAGVHDAWHLQLRQADWHAACPSCCC